MRQDAQLVDIACEVRGETDRAFRIFDGDREVWLPKSQVEIAAGVATMPEWLATEKGLV